MLDVRHISKSYGPVQALRDLSVQVAPGEFVAVRGPSGSGKTTLLLAAGGMLHPDQGQVLVGSQDVYQLGPEARARLRAKAIGFVFQQFHLVPYLSVLDNVLAAAVVQPGAHLPERARLLLNELGLAGRATQTRDFDP